VASIKQRSRKDGSPYFDVMFRNPYNVQQFVVNLNR
jgi:hypothetical protein